MRRKLGWMRQFHEPDLPECLPLLVFPHAGAGAPLTALRLAATAVRMDECEWALAGAVCVMGAPAAFLRIRKTQRPFR
jgi:hypothetical protein